MVKRDWIWIAMNVCVGVAAACFLGILIILIVANATGHPLR